MELTGKVHKISHSQAYLYQFLTRVENWEVLMPEKTEKFGVKDSESFYFQLKGMPEIRLKIDELTPEKQIILGSDSDKFEFYLKTGIDSVGPETAEVQFLFEGNFSSVMKMMMKKPLEKFIDQLGENLSKIQ